MIAFLDTCAIIYWVEMRDPQYQQFADKLHRLRKEYGLFTFAASELSLLECRVKPLREKNTAVLQRYQNFFVAEDLNLIPISLTVIDRAATLRADYNMPTPDAIQAAAAFLITDSKVIFITGDKAFKKIPHLHVLLV